MNIKFNGRNIAAVSLIEIMMIFAIIGIVTTACLGLAKPKYEYMKKIKLYSAFEMLENAGAIIANEGHIDYTTDINTCTNRNSYPYYCNDYNGRYPNLNNQLPKVSARASTTQGYEDLGINTTIYSSLSATEKAQFKYLQGGLCQRLVKVLSASSTSSCGDNISSTRLIDDNSSYPQDFSDKTPMIYLPNGMAIYLSKHLFNDFQGKNLDLGLTKYVVIADPLTPTFPVNSYNDYDDIISISGSSNYEGDILSTGGNVEYDFSSNCLDPNYFGECNYYMFFPNESRLTAVQKNIQHGGHIYNDYNFLEYYLPKVWSKNKDYFQIYVDINGKMTEGYEKQCGPDRLNEDIFVFRMYRDGTVIPDYRSGFPMKYLTAKVLVRNENDEKGRFRSAGVAYSIKPIVFARCYANMMGSYSSHYNLDLMGICTYGATGDASNGIKPLNECISATDDSLCKVIINKPSFLLR